ncbi:MAG: nitroreductase family protein [Muribaculaceae bacterium]|nr:nitroreductase family protein [Muribaculaceae bacterium]
MEFLDLVKTRQSDRAYDSTRSVEPEKLERILAAAHLAPSACNSQPWHIIVVQDKATREEVADALTSIGMNKFGEQAPVHLVIVEEAPNFTARLGGWVKNKHFPYIDCGILSAYITLAAAAEGLGSCVLGWFDEKQMRKVLDIPRSKRILLDIIIGYSVDKPRDKARKPIEEIVSADKY